MPEPGAAPFRRNRLVWTVYLLWGWWSFCMTLIGPAIPYLRRQFSMDYALAAMHMTTFALGMVLSGFLTPAALRRLGVMGGMWTGMAGCLAGTILLVLASSPGVSLFAVMIMSLFGSMSLTTFQISLTSLFPTRRAAVLMEATVVASLGSAAAPFLIALGAMTVLGWRIVAPALGLGLALVAAGGWSSTRSHARGDHAKLPDAGGGLPFAYWLCWLLLLAGVAVEWCLGFWSAEYLKDLPGRSLSVAAAGTGVYQVAAVASRLASSRIAGRVREPRFLAVGMLLVAAGFPLFWVRAGIPSAFLGLALCGAGTAVFYPLAMSLAVGSSGQRVRRATANAPIAIGLSVGLAPLSLGRLADRLGLATALWMVPLILGLMAVLLLLHRFAKARADLANARA